MAEMSPARIRGAIVSVKEVIIVTGMVAGYCVGYLFDSDPLVWSYVYIVILVVGAVPMLLTSFAIPRSVRWLLLKGHTEEAKKSIKYIYKTRVDEEFDELLEFIGAATTESTPVQDQDSKAAEEAAAKKKNSIFSHSKAFKASLGLTALQQLCGKPSMEGYSAIIFASAGLVNSSSVWMSLFMIASALVTTVLVDRAGRKILLQIGCTMQLFSLAAIGFAFCFFQKDVTGGHNGSGSMPTAAQVVVLVGMFGYVCGYEVSFGPLTWLVMSEVFPLESRGAATAFMVEINFLLNFLVQFLILVAEARVGWGPLFFVFAGVMIYSVYFIHHNVPETKGLTLEQIERTMGGDEECIANNAEEDRGHTERTQLLPTQNLPPVP
mmetsp:Transcript_33280/g.76697  ORF Transcript_33280/g.76697 Transcript_33280/m.76697 type:complete len:379 (-) Transcript_33280:421-1557(-)|eukprot:CAMPEP_0116833556 /NCGR_PEP_ID=MMETSP0418-20121206/6500_1 /TAXON_ID=1158023 /ORGANISM="Astrosyne radiata, Strain 13vi08-1A" /LENGTH=378 /DNA_ID=CAMNT_0004463015 /DNA_START=533 /DNA_END=1669 /DNA_ORIENTATION=-